MIIMMKRDDSELGMRRRVLGEEHPDTLATADTLVKSLPCQGKYSCGGPGSDPEAPSAESVDGPGPLSRHWHCQCQCS